MKSMQTILMGFASMGLLYLGACSNQPQAVNPTNSTPEPKTSSPAVSPSQTTAKSDRSKPSKGGQVVEAGNYYLEFVPEKEDNGTHLDLYFQKGDTHEAIPNAKVKAQVQLPNGEQKTLDLSYDAAGKHYAVLLPEKAPGEYKVVILSDVNGEKVNGRFSFNR